MYLIAFSFATGDKNGGRRIYGSTLADISLATTDLNDTLAVLKLTNGNTTRIHNVDYLPTEQEHPGDGPYRYFMIFQISYTGVTSVRHFFKVLPYALRTSEQLRQLELNVAAKLYAEGGCPENVELIVALSACKALPSSGM